MEAANINELFNYALAACSKERPVDNSLAVSDLLESLMRATSKTKGSRLKYRCAASPAIRYGLAGLEVDEGLLRRICADPKGWASEDEEVQQGAQFYEDLQTRFGLRSSDVADIMVYQQARSNFQSVQVENNWTSIVLKDSLSLFGKSKETMLNDTQLFAIASDIPALKSIAKEDYSWLLNILVERAEDYSLTEVFDDQDPSKDVACQFGTLYDLRDSIVSLCLYSRSCDWKRTGPDRYRSIECDRDAQENPDSISVTVGLGELEIGTGDATEARTFNFYRKDEDVIRWLD